ncbi:MAG: 4-hydroxy-tetrahydrodipicolinate synthase [Lachnospiraceae bacterium]|nr:4-hydroxy-tetrahydrodipicolinate synthase [Lachnospiraceae bacterium]
MSIFTGSAVAIITPFKNGGEVDYESFANIIEYQIANKTDAIVVCGTTGEASCLSHEEHLDVIGFCVKQVAGRVPVIAGTGSNCTETAIYLTKEADALGADAMLVVTPYYNKATQNGLIAHFTAVAASTKKPLILYNVPSRTGCKMAPATIATLYKTVDNLVAVKEATGDISVATEIAALTDGKMDIYSGNDDMIVPILSIGGKGVISVLSHVIPYEVHEMVASYLRGDTDTARDLQVKYFRLAKDLFLEVNPIPVKAATCLMGQCDGSVRMPLSVMEPQNLAVLRAEMEKQGILK